METTFRLTRGGIVRIVSMCAEKVLRETLRDQPESRRAEIANQIGMMCATMLIGLVQQVPGAVEIPTEH